MRLTGARQLQEIGRGRDKVAVFDTGMCMHITGMSKGCQAEAPSMRI